MNTDHPDQCPYSVGQMVVYRPSQRGIDEDVMSPPSEKLTLGKIYRIAAIQDEHYVLPEGYKHPGGGVYWTECAAE